MIVCAVAFLLVMLGLKSFMRWGIESHGHWFAIAVIAALILAAAFIDRRDRQKQG